MVFQKSSGFGFDGYHIPAMARGTRSARGRRSFRDDVEEKQMCAFELLATVAGKLLLERENSLSPVSPTVRDSNSPAVKGVVKQEKQSEVKNPLKTEQCDRGSSDEGTVTFDHKLAPKEYSQASTSAGAAVATSDESTEKNQGKVDENIDITMQVKRQRSGNKIGRPEWNLLCSEDPNRVLDAKPSSLASSDSSVEVPPDRSDRRDSRSYSLPKFRDDMGLADRDDDDEHSSLCTHPSTLSSEIYGSHSVGDGRIRKFSASKFSKVGATPLRDVLEEKPTFRSRKMFYTRERTQRSHFKKRRLFERGSVSSSLRGVHGENIKNSPENGIKGETSDSTTNYRSGEKKVPVKSEDCRVKLKIKSLKVPELFVEMSETATIGSLKRNVLETLTAVLGNGLRVGVIVQGKKVRDDSRTLLQAGISRGDKLDLGFTLEPNPSSPAARLPGSGESRFRENCDSPKPLMARLPVLPSSEWKLAEASVCPQGLSVTASGNHHVSRHPAKAPVPEEALSSSRALVPAPDSSGNEALAMVLSQRKPRRTELAQRRMRRPFSVAEVEALVQAVETLGTGRWRDVKIRAFENAKHRTYVDLKDKWKTLVHTARISPQQRRGEPVPQELLDRVLQAHAHWSKLQAKLQPKPLAFSPAFPPPTEQLLLH